MQLADRTQFAATLQYENKSSYDLRLKEPAIGHAAAEVVRLAKTEIAQIEDVDTWVTRIHHIRWYLAGVMGVLVAIMSLTWIDRTEFGEWMPNAWEFSKLFVPLLFGGVFVVDFLGALVQEILVAALMGDNSLMSNLFASVVGCLFYFATLTEIPILEALIKAGMASGPALALLLAGPALSLPSSLVIRKVIGDAKTAAFVGLVVVMAAVAGMGYGAINSAHTTLATNAPVAADSDIL